MKTIEAAITLGDEQMDITIEFKDSDFAEMDTDDLLFEIIAAASTTEDFKVEFREVDEFEAASSPDTKLH